MWTFVESHRSHLAVSPSDVQSAKSSVGTVCGRCVQGTTTHSGSRGPSLGPGVVPEERLPRGPILGGKSVADRSLRVLPGSGREESGEGGNRHGPTSGVSRRGRRVPEGSSGPTQCPHLDLTRGEGGNRKARVPSPSVLRAGPGTTATFLLLRTRDLVTRFPSSFRPLHSLFGRRVGEGFVLDVSICRCPEGVVSGCSFKEHSEF